MNDTKTFDSMEKGKVLDIGDCSYYMMEEYASRHKPRNDKAKALYNYIDKKYSTSVWFRRWFDEGGFKNLSFALRQLNRTKNVAPSPSLCDSDGQFVSFSENFNISLYFIIYSKKSFI